MTNQSGPSHAEQSPDNEYLIVDALTTPDFSPLPVGELLALALGVEQRKALERRVFDQASSIRMLEHAGGIGDALVSARQVRAAAVQFPGKQFAMYVPDTLLSLPFQLPANVTLYSAAKRDPDMSYDTDFFMCASPIFNAHQVILWDNAGLAPMKDLQAVQSANQSGHFATALLPDAASIPPALEALDTQFGTSLVGDNRSYGETSRMLQGRTLIVDTNAQELAEPLFKPFMEASMSPKYDLLIVPDAKEGTVSDAAGVERSLKSLSVSQWEAIAPQLPDNLTYAVVRGVDHPDYCAKVAELLQTEGKDVNFISTQTLGEFARVVAESAKALVMDSGTAHIAGEVVKAVQPSREIALRECYGQDTPYPLAEYAVRDLPPGLGKILASNIPLQNVPAVTLADFITS